MSPMLKSVEKAGIRALRAKRNPADIKAQDFFSEMETLREEFAQLINAPDPKRIVLIPSVSYGMATVARNLNINKGQHIIVAAEQFPSNYYCWQTLCDETGAEIKSIQPPQDLKDRGKKWNERMLESINSNTRAVAIANTHWADGTKFDLEAIRKRTREVKALLIIDGTQSVGALGFDIQKIQPDALVCAGYKWLLGPYSTGLAYYGEYFNDGKPIEESWMNRLNAEDFSALVNYQPKYQPGALRYEVGEHSNFNLVPMLIKSISQLKRWGTDNIQQYCAEITRGPIEKLRERGFWVEDERFRGAHLFGIRLPKGTDLKAVQESFARNKVVVSLRGDSVRVAPNVYNDENDLKKLVKVLTR
ncbi:MAG: aminotransferase class V-fold PLP-dependent enzyme [Bacteroidota bacterium]